MQRYDCHCHIFNIANIGFKAILEHLYTTETMFEPDISLDFDSEEEDESVQTSTRDKIRKLAELIRIFRGDSEKILDKLDEHYDGQYAFFPLMFDGDFILDAYHEEHLGQIKELVEHDEELEIPAKTECKAGSLLNVFRHGDKEDNKQVMRFVKELFSYLPSNTQESIINSGFAKQYDDIVALANEETYKGRFFPFLGVDPRRENISEYLSQVGKNKLFAGVKVYPPNGFSPMDKVLVGQDSIFEYCSKHQIPVFSHCSYGGFATPSKQIDVNGMIIPAGHNNPVAYDGGYTFKTALGDGFEAMVLERAETLNNPLIWEEVLKKYPDLILVLAHFGDGNDEWQANILQMMKTYPNLHTDVSCMSDLPTLQNVKAIYDANPDIQGKILYGSDYFLDMFFNDSFDQYLNRMKDTFGDQMFDKISSENPMRFMSKWYVNTMVN
jgi:predicted TIM-barrel fold metal-dependent hydrolase